MRYHFSGIAGAGMNPLARLMRARGHSVQGSDRSFDQGKNAQVAAGLAALGIVIKPQDGSAVTANLDRFVYSTAVEAETPEVRAARALGLERVPRPALLAEVVAAGRPGVAIAGTSGKSTITGMVGWLTRETGLAATVLGGAALAGDGTSGCFLPGPVNGPVAAEACESDGTLTGYHPALGLIHNISRDHGEVDALLPQFEAFAKRSGRLLVNSASAEAALLGRAVGARSYGAGPDADTPLEITSTGPHRARGILHLQTGPVVLDVPQPGLHNLENAAAAALIALDLGIAPATVAALLARFLRPELRDLMPRLLRPADRLCYAEIFYAGGTVAKDISSRMLADDLPTALGCTYAPNHPAVIDWIRAEARPGDTVLIMGARDPELPGLARAAFNASQTRPAA